MKIIKAGTKRPVIGLTGGMGSGKSTVSGYLCKRLDGTYIDADAICRELLVPGAAGYHSFKEVFGSVYLNPDLTVNRPLLRQAIFADEEVRQQLNQLLHPLARKEIARRVKFSPSPRFFLVEIPLLYEVHWETDLDRIIVVYAYRDCCLQRLRQRDGLSREEAERALNTQWPLPVKAMRADHVINNSGPWLFTCLQVLHLGHLLEQDFPTVE